MLANRKHGSDTQEKRSGISREGHGNDLSIQSAQGRLSHPGKWADYGHSACHYRGQRFRGPLGVIKWQQNVQEKPMNSSTTGSMMSNAISSGNGLCPRN